jgi:hypothetical protein
MNFKITSTSTAKELQAHEQDAGNKQPYPTADTWHSERMTLVEEQDDTHEDTEKSSEGKKSSCVVQAEKNHPDGKEVHVQPFILF